MRLVVIWGFVVLFVPSANVSCQCPVSGFNAPSNVCLNELVQLDNTSLNSVMYEWFFCNTDYTAAPSSGKIISDFGAVYYSKIIQHNGDTFLFFVSQTLNKLVGLRFTDLVSLSYEVHCEIDISGMITDPAGLDLINENGTWLGLVANIASPFKLVRFALDENLKSIAAFGDLSSVASLATPFQIEFVYDEENYYAFIANSTAPATQQLIRLSFGTSVSNLPSVSYIGLPVSGQSASFAFHETCNDWAAFVSLRNGKILRVNFGADLATATPFITELTLGAAINDPGGLSLVEDHEKLVMLIQSRNGNIYTATIESFADNTLDIFDFGNIKSSTRDWGIEIFRFEGEYKIVTANFTNGGAGGFYALNFPRICPGNIRYSTDPLETLTFHEAGTFKVTLKAKNAATDSHSSTKEIVVSTSQAPQLSVIHDPAYCVSSPVSFSFTSDLGVTTHTWEFGDGTGFSSDLSPDYSYANTGTFTVSLNVIADNGCKNLKASTITIYGKPQAGFSIPATLICTNNQFLFPATTPDTYNGNLFYQWFVGDNSVSTDRDLQYTFSETGAKEIKLVTAIPGCADEIVKTTSQVEAGPVVDFSFTGTCEDEIFSFQNEIADPVESYLWDFGDGNTAIDANPSEQFPSFGDYTVSLTATNAIGCQNVKTKTIAVHAMPLVDFDTSGPPNACSGSPTLFQNQTTTPDGRQLTEWLWHFSDPGDPNPKSEREPEHIFQTPDTYSVNLTAITASGCDAAAEKDIVIQESPSTDYRYTPACDDLPVVFSGPADPNIMESYWEIGTLYYVTSSPTHTFNAAGDYPLYLEVTASNGCVANITETIHVPLPLDPDFSVLKNCVNQEAIFTDITSGTDPVVAREWSFNKEEIFTGSPLLYTFTEEGNQNIALKVITASGCNYQVIKEIQILAPPVASFSSSPASGAYPLEVAFTNTSSLATHYRWEFLDGTQSTSVETSPVYTLEDQGAFDVVLTAFNEQECEDAFTGVITTVAPLPDADVEMITFTPNADGSMKLIVTIHNKGNTILKDIPLDVDFSGGLALRKILEGGVFPGAKHNIVFNTGIVDAGVLRYLCVSLNVENDLSPDGNRACKEFENRLLVFSSYPNPTKSTLHVEWISAAAGSVGISLIDPVGRTIFRGETVGLPGLNHEMMDLGGLQNGIYYLVIDDGKTVNRQRILVSH